MDDQTISLQDHKRSLRLLFDLFTPYTTAAQRELVGDQYLAQRARDIFGKDHERIMRELGLVSAPPAVPLR